MEFNGTRTVHIGNLSKLKRPKIGCMKPGKLNVTVWNEKGYLKELQDNKSYGCEVTLSKELSFSRYVLGNISIDEKTYSSGYDSTLCIKCHKKDLDHDVNKKRRSNCTAFMGTLEVDEEDLANMTLLNNIREVEGRVYIHITSHKNVTIMKDAILSHTSRKSSRKRSEERSSKKRLTVIIGVIGGTAVLFLILVVAAAAAFCY